MNGPKGMGGRDGSWRPGGTSILLGSAHTSGVWILKHDLYERHISSVRAPFGGNSCSIIYR